MSASATCGKLENPHCSQHGRRSALEAAVTTKFYSVTSLQVGKRIIQLHAVHPITNLHKVQCFAMLRQFIRATAFSGRRI